MKIAIHYNDNMPKDSYSRKWEERLKNQGVDVLKLDFYQTDIIAELKQAKADGAMWHWFHTPSDRTAAPHILTSIELGLEIPVFPNLATRWHYDEKITGY